MKVLARTQFGDPILRQVAQPVPSKKILSSSFQRVIKGMFYTMKRANGVGLAASQIGESWQLAVIEIKKSKVRPAVKPLKKTVIINPRITRHSKKLLTDWEGCLSLPGIRGLVPRYEGVTVSFLDESEKRQTLRLKGFQARAFQHEIDHLRGVLYVDRMQDLKTLMTVSEFKKRILRKGGLKNK